MRTELPASVNEGGLQVTRDIRLLKDLRRVDGQANKNYQKTFRLISESGGLLLGCGHAKNAAWTWLPIRASTGVITQGQKVSKSDERQDGRRGGGGYVRRKMNWTVVNLDGLRLAKINLEMLFEDEIPHQMRYTCDNTDSQ